MPCSSFKKSMSNRYRHVSQRKIMKTTSHFCSTHNNAALSNTSQSSDTNLFDTTQTLLLTGIFPDERNFWKGSSCFPGWDVPNGHSCSIYTFHMFRTSFRPFGSTTVPKSSKRWIERIDARGVSSGWTGTKRIESSWVERRKAVFRVLECTVV